MSPTEREDIAFMRRKPLVDVAARASSCEAGGAASEGRTGGSLKTWSGSGFDQGHNSLLGTFWGDEETGRPSGGRLGRLGQNVWTEVLEMILVPGLHT